MPKIHREAAPSLTGSRYPAPYDEPCRGRTYQFLGDAAGLTQFGVHFVTLAPGAWSSQRHWHHLEDEFAYVLEGEVVLIEDEGETLLGAGDCAAWKAGVQNGHHLVNRSAHEARLLVVGSRNPEDHGEYSDIDMAFGKGRYGQGGGYYSRKDGGKI